MSVGRWKRGQFDERGGSKGTASGRRVDIDLEAERWYTKIRESLFYTHKKRRGGVCLLTDEPILTVEGGNCLRNPILLGIRG